jgi:hypothetical protein
MEGYNIWTQELQRKLEERFPDTTFTFVNFGLDSRNITMMDNDSFLGVASPDPGDGTGFYRAVGTYSWQVASTIGKSWINHLKDEKPDLVVLEFGLNSNLTAANFKTTYQSVIDKLKDNTKVPTIALMTDMMGNLTTDPYKDAIGKIRRYNEKVREVVYENDLYLIDVGRQWSLKTWGEDDINITEERISLDQTVQIAGSVYDAATYNSMTKAAASSVYGNNNNDADHVYRDLTITGNYNPTNASSNIQCGIRFYGADAWSAGVAVQLKGTSTQIYEDGSSVVNLAHAEATLGSNNAFEISIVGDDVTVKVGGTTVATHTCTTKRDWGRYAIGVNDGDINNIDMRVTRIALTDTAKYNNNEMLGSVTAGGWAAGNFTEGGNSLNHPSRIGLREGFYPPIYQFVNAL